MSQTPPIPATAFEELSLEEKVDYVEQNIDEIVSSLQQAEIPQGDKDVLIKAMRRFRYNVENAITWEEFEQKLMQG